MQTGDDAGVYRLSDELAIIQTVDFITPIVDDPFTFGQIAAANSLSDVYAMGGRPVTAMNVVCFPVRNQDISILKDILRGGLDKLREAEVALVGGHSVEDQELKYGLSVTGVIHPSKVIAKDTAQVGDRLILTKPIGTGIVTTAFKGGEADDESLQPVVHSMTTLNRRASELMVDIGISACTDVTGFGLLGHARGMVEKNRCGIVIHLGKVPVFPEVKRYVEMGLVPGGTKRNMEFHRSAVEVDSGVSDESLDILFDAQTSGGLLISVPGDRSESLLKKLHANGIQDAAIIGEIVAEPKGKIIVRG